MVFSTISPHTLPIDEFLVNLAASLVSDLLNTAARYLRDAALGDDEERALRRAYEQAFAAMLQSVAPQVNSEMVDHLESLLRSSIRDDEEFANILLDIALKNRALPRSQLRARFEAQGFDPETLPVDFDTAVAAFVDGLAKGLQQEAVQPGSPLYNRVSLIQLLALREGVLGAVYDLEQPRSCPPTHEALNPAAQIPDDKGIEEESVGNRHLAIQSALEHHPLVVVCGPSGRGKSWEVARLARSRAHSYETCVLWLSLDKGDSLDSILSPEGKLADRLRALRIPFEVDPRSSTGDRGARLLTTLQRIRLLVCLDDYHEVEESYRDEFEQLFLRMRDRLVGSPTHVVIINRNPIRDLPSIELDRLDVGYVAQWISGRCPESEGSHWITDRSKAVELAIILKDVCQDNYFAMKNLIEMFKEGIGYPEAREWAEKHAPEAMGKAIWQRVPQVVRTIIRAQEDLLGSVSIDAILVFVPQDDKEDIVQAIDWLTEGGILERRVKPQIYYTLREEARPYFDFDPEEDRALLCRMAEYFERENKHVEACKLYLAAERFDQAIALLSQHSLDLRNRGLAVRMYDLIDGVNRDMLEDWLNRIRLWTIRADFLAWTDRFDEAEDLAKIGLATIEARGEEDRSQCRLEEIKLWIRRGIPSARRREFENAYTCFKKAERLLLAHQETIRAKPETSEAERLSVVEQELILKNNLGLVYLNLALKQRDEDSHSEKAQENALKAKEAFGSGFRTARAQACTNRNYSGYLNHLAAWLKLQLARYYEQWEGDYERAAASYGSALSTLKEIGASSAAVNCANSMAVCLAGADHFDEALKYAEESRRLAEELRDWEGVAMAYATMSCDVYLAQAKKAEDSSKKEEFITKARKAFDLSWDHGHEIESADLLYAWQLILTDLIDLQGEQADPELQQKLECVEKSIRMLENPD